MHFFKSLPHIDFLRWRWHAVALSWIVILAGLGVAYTKGIPKGIEFAGGTSVIAQFQQPTSVEAVRDVLDKNYPGADRTRSCSNTATRPCAR
jgi:preprotein translocase subunit SecF